MSLCLLPDDGTCTDPECADAEYEAEVSGGVRTDDAGKFQCR